MIQLIHRVADKRINFREVARACSQVKLISEGQSIVEATRSERLRASEQHFFEAECR